MSFTYKGVKRGRNGDPYGEETLIYIFHSDDDDDSAVELYQHQNCPRIYSKNPYYYWKWCVDHPYTQRDENEYRVWEIEAKYVPMPEAVWKMGEPTPLPPPSAADPNEMPRTDIEEDAEVDFMPHVRHHFEEFATPVKTAYNATEASTRAFGTKIQGNYAIVKSNLEPYDPPPEMIENNLIIDIQRNIDVGDFKIWGEVENLRNAINTQIMTYVDFKINIPAHCARFRYSAGDKVEYKTADGFSKYRNLNVQLVIDWKTWQLRLPDIGSYKFSVAGTKTIEDRIDTDDWNFPVGAEAEPFYDEDNNRIEKNLDGKGNDLGASTAPKFNEYTVYRKQDMRAFLHYLTDGEIV